MRMNALIGLSAMALLLTAAAPVRSQSRGVFSLGNASWAAWLGQALLGGVQAQPAKKTEAAKPAAKAKPTPTPAPAKPPAAAPAAATDTPAKRKVILLCYTTDWVMKERCKNYRAMLNSKGCTGVEFVEDVPENASEEDLAKFLADKKLPKDTITLVSGHAAGIEQKVGKFNAQGRRWVEPVEDWWARLETGKDHSLALPGNVSVPTSKIKGLLEKNFPGAPQWYATCGAGGVCATGGCTGGSCQATEVTIMSKKSGWLDPPTQQIVSLLCSPELRKKVDGNSDGTIDKKELETMFRCDAKRFPATYTQSVGPDEDFLDGLDPKLSKEVRQQKIADHMAVPDERAVLNAVNYLGQHLVYSPEDLVDAFDKRRVAILQKSYRKLLTDKGAYDPKTKSLDLKKFRAILKVDIEKVGYGNHRVNVSLPEDLAPTCYFGGLDSYFPDVDVFSLPTH